MSLSDPTTGSRPPKIKKAELRHGESDTANNEKARPKRQSMHFFGNLFARLLAFLFALSFLAAGIGIFVGLGLPTLLLPTLGASTQGTVERLIKSKAERGGGLSMNHVYYVFASPSGENIHRHTQLSSQAWASLNIGQSVKAFYFARFPSVNILADYPQWWLSYLLMITFPPLFGGFGLWMMVNFFRTLFDRTETP